MRNNSNYKVKKLVMLALFCALAYATMFVLRIRVSFLTFDAKDALITIAGMMLGPASAAVSSLIVALLEFLTVSDTGFYGLIMNFASTSAFAVTASLIYKFKRNIRGAMIGLGSGVAAMTAVMLALNLLITPRYMNCDISQVAQMIPTLLLPFNLTKALLNASLVMLLYKPVSTAAKRVNAIPSLPDDRENGDRNKYHGSLFVIITAAVIAVSSLIVFFILLNGDFELIKK